MKKEQTCKQCHNIFLVEIRELNRNNGLFCSRTCNAIHRNEHRKLNLYPCKHCGKQFSSVNTNAKYCSSLCKQKNYRLKSKSNNTKDKKLLNLIREYFCEICNYSKVSRDVHHITPVSKGGKNEYSNLISVCPNCHREIHNELVSQHDLLQIIKYRTISSSLRTFLKEQDANSGN